MKESELQRVVNRLQGIFEQADWGMSDIQELKAYRELARDVQRMKQRGEKE